MAKSVCILLLMVVSHLSNGRPRQMSPSNSTAVVNVETSGNLTPTVPLSSLANSQPRTTPTTKVSSTDGSRRPPIIPSPRLLISSTAVLIYTITLASIAVTKRFVSVGTAFNEWTAACGQVVPYLVALIPPTLILADQMSRMSEEFLQGHPEWYLWTFGFVCVLLLSMALFWGLTVDNLKANVLAGLIVFCSVAVSSGALYAVVHLDTAYAHVIWLEVVSGAILVALGCQQFFYGGDNIHLALIHYFTLLLIRFSTAWLYRANLMTV